MPNNSLWIRQDTNEFIQTWFLFMSAEARLAWLSLKNYVMLASTSQKRPGEAIAMDVQVAAHQWRISEVAVQEMLDAAVKAGKLSLEDGQWNVLDKSSFVSEKTIKRGEAVPDKQRQTQAKEAPKPQKKICPTNEDKQGQTETNEEKYVACDTDTDKDNNPPSAIALVPPEGEQEGPAEVKWWSCADTFDPVACELVSTIRSSKGYAGFDPPRQAVDDLLAWVRGFAPDDQVIRSVFDGFKERADAKRGKTEYTDVLRTLRNWFGSREAQWRSVRRQREIDSRHAAKSQPSGVAQMYADAYNSFAEEAAS